MITLSLRADWQGVPLPEEEHVHLTLTPTPDALVLAVDAPFYDDEPPDAPPGPCWKLWEHEVVELFILGSDDRYLEIELGPRNHHLVLQLHGQRNIVARMLPLDFTAQRAGARWTGHARIPRAMLPPGPHRINAYAIHGPPVQRRHLAWKAVPGNGPDFHRLEHFGPIDLDHAERKTTQPD